MNVHRRRSNRHKKRSSLYSLCSLAILALCLASLLTPFAQSSAANQQENGTECPFLQHWEEQLGKCVGNRLQPVEINQGKESPPATEPVVVVVQERDQEIETPVDEVDIPIVIPVETSTVASAAAATGSVAINKHRCPTGYDPSGATYYDLAAACTESPNGLLFGISDGVSEIATGTTGSAFPGGFQVSGLPIAGTAIYEKNVPAGGASTIFCDGYTPEEGGPSNWGSYYETVENQIFYDFNEAPLLYCDWFNFIPAPEGTGSLVINKIGCPADYDASAEDQYDLALNCHDTVNGIEFGVSDGASEIATATTGAPNDGNVTIDGLPEGAIAVYEKNTPAGQGSVVFCAELSPDDNAPANFVKMSQSEPNQIFHVLEENETLFCNWYNVTEMQPGTPEATPEMGGYGDVTIYKWTCPEGFDPYLPGADPVASCTEPANGVIFTMDRPGKDPLQSSTGDSIPGAVFFGGQDAGTYTITESLPDGFAMAFTWNCTGASTDWVHPTPLNVGTTLSIAIADGDSIVCNWYNVPEMTPETGHLTLYKYVCSGSKYVSDVDCEIYEYGKTFDLLVWDGSVFGAIDSQTTNPSGTITWSSLSAGTYRVNEVDGEPCRIDISAVDANGNLVVTAGQDTVVKVYNCTAPGATPVAGKAPTKYPNTGVEQPDQAELPLNQESTPVDAATCPVISAPDAVGSDLATNAPLEGTCPRGQVPANLVIESLGVNANVEVLETVDGVMQAPTTADMAAWYKESSRLGEQGNIVIAGHLNYWGVPEGVFFNLDDLEEGDTIALTGEDGSVYRYEVVWSVQIEVGTLPADLVGSTDGESITLITCGGEWNSAISEYDHRTVVRAERVGG